MISRIDHVSFAVKDYEKAVHFFQDILGAVTGAYGEDDNLKYFWHVFSLGDLTRIELIKPAGEGSFLDNFLSDKRDGGVHHITMETPDILHAKKVLEENGIPYFGFNDLVVWKELFIHPKDAFGVLIQIAEFNPDDFIGETMKLSGDQRWSAKKTDNGCNLSLAHPGGGKVEIELTKDEIRKLISDLDRLS